MKLNLSMDTVSIVITPIEHYQHAILFHNLALVYLPWRSLWAKQIVLKDIFVIKVNYGIKSLFKIQKIVFINILSLRYENFRNLHTEA